MKPIRLTTLACAIALGSVSSVFSADDPAAPDSSAETPVAEAETPVVPTSTPPRLVPLPDVGSTNAKPAPGTVVADDAERTVETRKPEAPAKPAPEKPAAEKPVSEPPVAEPPAAKGLPEKNPATPTFAGDNGAVTPADLRKDIEGLSKRIDALESKLRINDLAAVLGAISAKLDAAGGAGDSADVRKQAEELGKSLVAARRAVRDLSAELDKLQKSVDAVVGAADVRPGDSAETTAGRPVGPSPGTTIPADQGKLILINNDPAAEKILYINGQPWQVRVGRSYIPVPLKDVSIGPKGNSKVFSNWKKNPKTDRYELTYEF